MNRDPAILWFRNDLRLSDNAALAAAVKRAGSQVVYVYIRETDTNARRAGGASDWWLDKSLRALQDDLRCLGGDLILRSGNPAAELAQLIRETGATSVFWNRRYAKQARDLDADIKATLRDKSICVETFNGTLLNEPWTIATKTGAYYKVFTPYWRAASQQ
ncbi:MAG: deoxyribodipyrimidine photo-lyase, partial [Pseudomonadota bacterium]|nr:deoxyribodipyrimidine photo-lyase [Pseudomonadota bacterium]